MTEPTQPIQEPNLKISVPLIEVVGGKFELTNTIDGFLAMASNAGEINLNSFEATKKIYLYLKCNCGKEYEYKTAKDVPSKSVICKCGQEIIKYKRSAKKIKK